jgi:hypothetical protein
MLKIINAIKKEKEAEKAATDTVGTIVVVPSQPPVPQPEPKKEPEVKKELEPKKEIPQEIRVLEKIHNDPKTIYVKNMFTDHYVLDNNVTIVTRHKDNTYTIYDEKGPRKFNVDLPTQTELLTKPVYYMPEDALKDMVTPRDGKLTKTTVKKKEKEDAEAEKKKMKAELAQQGIFVVPNDSNLLQKPPIQSYPYLHPAFNPAQFYPPNTLPMSPSPVVQQPILNAPVYPFPYPYGAVSPGSPLYNPEDAPKKLKPAIKKSVSISNDQPRIHAYGDQETINELMSQMSSLLANERNQHSVLPPIKSQNNQSGWYESPPEEEPFQGNWYESPPPQANKQYIGSPNQNVKIVQSPQQQQKPRGSIQNQTNEAVQTSNFGWYESPPPQANKKYIGSPQQQQKPRVSVPNPANEAAQTSNLGWYESPPTQATKQYIGSPNQNIKFVQSSQQQQKPSIQITANQAEPIQETYLDNNLQNNSPDEKIFENSPSPRAQVINNQKRISIQSNQSVNLLNDSTYNSPEPKRSSIGNRASIVSSNSSLNEIQKRKPSKFKQTLNTTTKRIAIQPQILDEEEAY